MVPDPLNVIFPVATEIDKTQRSERALCVCLWVQAGGPVSQQNTFFSKAEKSGRGDTSIWTDTPADKAQKAKMQ